MSDKGVWKGLTKHWTDKFQFLIGSKIIKVNYMSDEDADELGWDDRPIQIHLDNGAILSPQRDDEGNDGGALYTACTNTKCRRLIWLSLQKKN